MGALALPPASRVPMQPTPSILGQTLAQFTPAARAAGAPAVEVAPVFRTFHRTGVLPDPTPAWVADERLPLGAVQVEGQTLKFTLRLPNGLETESVVIPMLHRTGRASRTLCVSSQVGCAMGCRFCETAQMGLLHSLSAAHIVAQLHAARFLVENPFEGGRGFAIKNIVFMGMGEPMDNLDAVMQAIRVMADPNAYAIPPSNIAVSTVGRTDGIRRFGELVSEHGFHRLNLAVSLNAPNDAIRTQIMPIARSEPLDTLMAALLAFPKRPNAAICVEYVLIPGVNDALEHCDEVCRLLKPLRCSLNVIPYNPRRNSPWPAPTEEGVQAWVDRAVQNCQFCKRRGTKGRSVMAACGQLGSERIRQRRFVDSGQPVSVNIRANAS
ncbi:MAG: 23S rRNA (adenine(2503)-C(2))-methyltransferase RlmN [Phycisphaerales bacterium]